MEAGALVPPQWNPPLSHSQEDAAPPCGGGLSEDSGFAQMRLAKPAAVPGYLCSPGLVGGGKVEVMTPSGNKSDKMKQDNIVEDTRTQAPDPVPLSEQSRKKTNQKENKQTV